MAVFSVFNGTGLNGAGIQFDTLSQIASSGVAAGSPSLSAFDGNAFFNDNGFLAFGGFGMSFAPPDTFGGTVLNMSYSKPLGTPVFAITGMNTPLATVAAGFLATGGETAALAAIFSGNDAIGGSTQADRLYGFDGDDSITGGDGNDTLRGGAGADTLDGGNGSDFVNYQGSSARVVVDLQFGVIEEGDAQGDVLTSIENIYGSSHGGDQLFGNAVRNIIGGEAGGDNIGGRAGDDSLSGEAGDDTIHGDDGADRLTGGGGEDSLYGDAGNDSIDAGADQDFVNGNAGDDSLLAGAGNDTLDGEDGNDLLEGGEGADQLVGRAGIDTVSYASSATGVTVALGDDGAGTSNDGDYIYSVEQAIGSAFADSITGNSGANTLWGMDGDDVLTGGGGADVLKGGAGNDSFRYVATGDSSVAADGRDTIMDFATGDRIDLSAIDANGEASGDTAFIFGTGAFTAAGQIRVLDFGGSRYGVYLETTGNRVEDAIIAVYSDHALTAADFVL